MKKTSILSSSFWETTSERKLLISLFIYVFFILLMCSHMSPLYYTNEWSDVNTYYTIGKAMCNGKVLYTDIFDHKGPLIFFIYGLGYMISDTSFFGMFLIQVLAWYIMVLSVYKLALLYLNKLSAIFIALIFPAFLIKLMITGGSAEEFILIFECISLYFFVKYFKLKEIQEHSPKEMMVHGLMCSMAFFIKINLIMFWFFPLLGIYIGLLYKKKFKNLLFNAGSFILGVLLIGIPICLYLYTNNALTEAYDIYITLNRKYAEIQSFEDSIKLLIYRHSYLYMDPISLVVLAIAGVFYAPFQCIENKIGRVSMILSGIIMYIVIYMPRVFQYYYPIPYLVFSAFGLISVLMLVNKFIVIKQYSYKHILFIGFVCSFIIYSQKSLTDLKIIELSTGEKPKMITQKLHDKIMEEKDPSLLFVGYGLANSLFTSCNIIPEQRYFIAPNFTYESYPNIRNEQTKYIENKETKFVVMQIPLIKNYTMRHYKVRKINQYEYFLNLPAFKQNYELALSDTINNTIDDNFEIYQLFKRKD